MGCVNISRQSSTVEPLKVPNGNIVKQNKILNHSTTKKKIALNILNGLEEKNNQAEDMEMAKQKSHKKVQQQKTYEEKRDLLHKQFLKSKYPPNFKIQEELKHSLPQYSNLQSKFYLRDVKEELIFIESKRVGIVQHEEVIYDGYCNEKKYDGFGMLIQGSTHQIGQFFEGKEMYGQGLFTNPNIFQLGKFMDYRLQGQGVYYRYVQEKKEKIFKGNFLQDQLDNKFPNHIIKYIKLQKYFGYTLNNRIDNFGFLIEKNQISQFVYHRDRKKFKISDLKSLYQNLSYIELFKVWSQRVQNLIQFILNIKENQFIEKLENLKDKLNEFWQNQLNAEFKRKKYLILAKWNPIIMKQFIEDGSFIMIYDNFKISIKLQSKLINECIIFETSKPNQNNLEFQLQGYTIRLKLDQQNQYLHFGNYDQNLQNGVFQQYGLTEHFIDLTDFLDGEKQLKLTIKEEYNYCMGIPIRKDESLLKFQIPSDENIVCNFKQHSKYKNIELQFQIIIEQIIEGVASFQTYFYDEIYYKGQWKGGKFDGIGIKYNKQLNQFNLGIFVKNFQQQYGFQIESKDQKFIVELSEFKNDKKQGICKIQELSENEQLVLYVNKEEGVKQKDGIMIVENQKFSSCKIQELSDNEQLVLYVNKEEGVKQKDGIKKAENQKYMLHFKDDIHYQIKQKTYLPCEFYQNEDKSVFSKPFKDVEKDKKFKLFKRQISKEQILERFQKENFPIFNLFGQQMQGKFIQEFDKQEFGRSIRKKDPSCFEIYYGMFLRGKRRGFGKLLVLDQSFQLHIGIFDEVKNQQEIFIKVFEDTQKIEDPQKMEKKDPSRLKYEITDQYLYNLPEINSKEIIKEYEKNFEFAQMVFYLNTENQQILSKFKPMLRTVDNDLIFLKTQAMDKVFKSKINNDQTQYYGEIESGKEVTGYVITNNEQEDLFSFGYIYKNKFINTYLQLTSFKIYKQQEDLVYKSIKAKTSFIKQIKEDDKNFILKKRNYPHKIKYLLKLKDNENEFGATFHENGLCQYFQQINKKKVYPSNGQVDYKFKKISLDEQNNLYESLVQNDEFQLSLQNWILDKELQNSGPVVPVILKPGNQYYSNQKDRNATRKFWNKGKKISSERFNNTILIRMVNYNREQSGSFQFSLDNKPILSYWINKNNQLQKQQQYSIELKSFIDMDNKQFDNFLKEIAKDNRLQKYFYKVLKVKEDLEKLKKEQENKIDQPEHGDKDKLKFDGKEMIKKIIQDKQIKFNISLKAYIHILKDEQRALIINEDYLYFGQYDETSPHGYGFAYYPKDKYKYKGQWVKGLKEGWGYITYFFDQDLINKQAKEKQFDRFNSDIAENLPDLSVYQQVKFPLIDLSAQQIEFINNCKNIYFYQAQLYIDSNKFKSIFFSDLILNIRNEQDENNFKMANENSCFKEFKLVAFKNKQAGSIYLGNWSKKIMHGYGKIIYQSDNFYSGFFKYGQRDFRGLYLKNIQKKIDESLYIGFWKEDRQHSNYYQSTNLNQQSLQANNKEIYIGDFKQDQQVGSAKIYDYNALSENIKDWQPKSEIKQVFFKIQVEPKSEIKQVFKTQVDSKNFKSEMIYMGDSDQPISLISIEEQQQPTPKISDIVLELMKQFKLRIEKKKNIQKDLIKVDTYCPLYFKIQLFDQEFYYQGQWSNYKPSGEGFALNFNTYIEGKFKDGLMTNGYYICKNYQYNGDFQHQKMEGKGEYQNNTINYNGWFISGQFHGGGTLKFLEEGKLKFLDHRIQKIQSGNWENGVHKVEKKENDELLPYGTAIKFSQQINQRFVDIAKIYNYVLKNEYIGFKYVQSENFYFGDIKDFKKQGQGLLLTRDNILYFGEFNQDKFIDGLIIKEDLVQIISFDKNQGQSKMLEYIQNESYQFYGNCKLIENIGIYEKTNGQLIKDNKKYVGSFIKGKKYEGKIIYEYGCIIDLIYGENEKIENIEKIQYQITSFMRNIMNKFNLYSISVIENAKYSQLKFDEIEYFSIEDPFENKRILINEDKIIYQHIYNNQAFFMFEYDLKNSTFYLGGVKNDKKQQNQALQYDQTLDEIYFGSYEAGKKEGNGRLIKQNQILIGNFKDNQMKSGKIYNQDGSYFKITQDKNQDIKKMIYHLGNLDERWTKIDKNLEQLKQKINEYQKLEGYSEFLEGQDDALEIYEKMAKKWSECKESIKKMNIEGCKLDVEQSIVVPISAAEISRLVVLKPFSITHDLIKDGDGYFGCCYNNNELVLGYFDKYYETIKEVIIFYEDGSIKFQKLQDKHKKIIRYFFHQPNIELQSFQQQLKILKKENRPLFKQAKDKIKYQLQDVIVTNRNFFRLLYSSLIYKGCVNGVNDPNGYGEAFRSDYYFKGYRQNGNRRFGEVYEKQNHLYYGELDGYYNGLGIKIGLDYQFIGQFKDDSWNGEGKMIKNGIIIEAIFELDNIRQIKIQFDDKNFRPKILYDKISENIVYEKLKFDQFIKEIQLKQNNFHRIYENKGDIIFENGNYQYGTFQLGILQDGLYYNKKEDKIYIGKFELGYLNAEKGFTFDGKILIEGKFYYGIMNPKVITWYSDNMEQLSRLEFENGNPVKILDFKPKLWQEILMEKKGLKQPYKVEANQRFLVFQLENQQPYQQIYIDVFSNELLYIGENERVLIHYEDGQYLEIFDYNSYFYEIKKYPTIGFDKKTGENQEIGEDQKNDNDKNSNQYEYNGPGFFNMKHYENKNQDHQYKYDKQWCSKKIQNQETGVYEIQEKYVFGKLVRKKQEHQNKEGEVQQQQNEKQNKQQELKYKKYQLVLDNKQLDEYDQKLQAYLTNLSQILKEQIQIQEKDEKKNQTDNKEQEINPNSQKDIQQQIDEQKDIMIDENIQIQQEQEEVNEQNQREQDQ